MAIPLRVLLAVALAAGCQQQEPTPAVIEEVEELRVEGPGPDTLALPRAELEQARRTATALGQDLAGLVFATMQAEGPAAAVRVCSEVAQERTAAHAAEGVYVRRVSDRLRNPHNRPDDAEERELERIRRTGRATCSRRSPRCRNRTAPWPSGSMRSSKPARRSLAENLVRDARVRQGRQGRLLLPERAEVQDEVRDARLQRHGEPRRRRHVADRLRAEGADCRRRGKDQARS
jgi:hypothetical protein